MTLRSNCLALHHTYTTDAPLSSLIDCNHAHVSNLTVSLPIYAKAQRSSGHVSTANYISPHCATPRSELHLSGAKTVAALLNPVFPVRPNPLPRGNFKSFGTFREGSPLLILEEFNQLNDVRMSLTVMEGLHFLEHPSSRMTRNFLDHLHCVFDVRINIYTGLN